MGSWRQIEEIFLQAIEVPQSAREAFLRDACGPDEELLRTVENLLRRDEQAGENQSPLIEGIIRDAAAGLFGDDHSGDSMAGAVIGKYRIVREIGRGGMGAVYLAIREDLGFEKQVAIKLVKLGIDTDMVLQRFRRERRILAALDHPYIARLLDGGASPEERPYFVMEYVNGKPLDDYRRQAGPSLNERCELFRKICEAVAYAHRSLIIHRDLKPANILVTAEGTPKLLDFGIARLLSAGPGEQTVLGGSARLAMTPEFASPEQIAGATVTTATDVYSLGATMRVVLTAEGDEVLPADLQVILGKATRLEPDERYASVGELSEDLRRYLEGLPITAREPSWSYRMSRFVQRHRFGTAAGVVFSLLILITIAGILHGAHEAERQRKAAELRLGQAVEMADRTLAQVNGIMQNLPGTTAARQQMIRGTEEYLDQLARGSRNDRRVLTALATSYVRVADVQGNPEYANLGDTASALGTYRKALDVIGLLPKAEQDSLKLLQLAGDAHLGIADVLGSLDRNREAEAEYRVAIGFSDRILAAAPKDEEVRLRWLTAHLLSLEHYPSDKGGAEQAAAPYLEEAIRLAKEYPQDPATRANLAAYYSLFGSIAGHHEALHESLSYYRKCIELREELLRRDPRNPSAIRALAISYGQAGDFLGSPILLNLGDVQGALQYFRKEAQIMEQLSRSDPSDKRARYDVGIAWMRVGVTLQAKGDIAGSDRALTRAMTEFGTIDGPWPDHSPYLRALGLVYEYEGRNRMIWGDRQGAKSWYGKSLAVASEQLRKDPRDMPAKRQFVQVGGPLALLLTSEGDLKGAHQVMEQTLRESEGTLPTWQARAWKYQAQVSQLEGDCGRAIESFQKAISIWSREPAVRNAVAYSTELREAEGGLATCRLRR